MTILAFGVNHTTAPVELRERVSFSSESMPDALTDLNQQRGVREAAILSTCNRTEIYCSLDEARESKPLDWFYDFHGIKQDQIQQFIYTYPDANAVKHVLRVASGLDSMHNITLAA